MRAAVRQPIRVDLHRDPSLEVDDDAPVGSDLANHPAIATTEIRARGAVLHELDCRPDSHAGANPRCEVNSSLDIRHARAIVKCAEKLKLEEGTLQG